MLFAECPVQSPGGVSRETSPTDSYDHSQPRQPRENCAPRCLICPQEQSVLIARGKGWSAATFATSDGMPGIASINMLNHHVNLPPCPRYEVLQGPYSSRGREELVGAVNPHPRWIRLRLQCSSETSSMSAFRTFHVEHPVLRNAAISHSRCPAKIMFHVEHRGTGARRFGNIARAAARRRIPATYPDAKLDWTMLPTYSSAKHGIAVL